MFAARLRDLGIELPPVATPLAAYVPARRVGSQVWTSGQLPLADGALIATGTLGAEIEVVEGSACARAAALNALAAAAHVAGGVDGIAQIHRVVVYVASAPGFVDQAQVANGASLLFQEIFGEKGVHVRSAVGVSALPLGAPVEVELVVELR
ncbi:MAG: RidA family protein [Arachnia sp.]